MNKIEEHLEAITNITKSNTISNKQLLFILKDLFEYLSSPYGRTDENCKIVDSFLTDNDDFNFDDGSIDEKIVNIIGHCDALHDTILSPSIADNFSSTPEQILAMINDLIISEEIK